MNEDKKFNFDFDIFDHFINKYRNKDVDGIVYKLSYAGKFIIVKGKTLAGSLIILAEGFDNYRKDVSNARFKNHLYKHFFDHLIEHSGRFRMTTVAKLGKDVNQYRLLQKEQMELDKHRYNQKCLNNAVEAYIPNYNSSTDKFGWIDKSDAMNFKKWLNSKSRVNYIARYGKKPALAPAKSGLLDPK